MNFSRHSAASRGKYTMLASAGVTALSLAAFATPAYAQDPSASTECVDEDQNGQCDVNETNADGSPATSGAIVVTGSRISRPTLSSPIPLTTVTVNELTDTGDVSLGDALNDLPSLRTTYSQGNSTRFIGTAGLNLLDLRGLGVSRTLVLVNGKRHITASPGDYLVDTNTIPVDLLERVDIVTGGNSAVYGSDAVAGVVNFVLKRDFDGIAIRGQSGVSSRGDRPNQFISATVGKNFADGRGNIAISGEFAKSTALYYNQRDSLTGAFSGRCQYNVVSDDQSDEGIYGTDGITDLEPICGVRNGSISDGGTIGGLGNGVYLRFDQNGNLITDVPDQYLPFSGNVIGGQGSTLRNTGQLAAGLKRYSINVLAHYDISDAFRPFVEAKYVRVDAVQEGQPSFFTGGPDSFFGSSPLLCSNPFLNAQARNVLTNQVSTCARRVPGTTTIALDANGNRIFDGSRRVPLSRFNIDFGGRGEDHKRETYRIVGGVEGDFNEDWHYELSLNYGEFRSHQDSVNNLLLYTQDGTDFDGFSLAADAVLAPAGFTGSNFVLNSSGQKVICAVNAATNTRPDCYPINLFGFGVQDPRALAFSNTTGFRDEKATEFDALFSLAGDLSQLFELPGGPISFALGAEYREETAYSAFDPLTASGATFLNAIQPFNPPKLTVKEAFGELQIPLLRDLPFAQELTISGAGRVSDYNTATGTVYAYNVQGIYAPIRDIRFRAGYATSVRAPTQSDLYSPQSQNFAFIADPCDIATGAINNDPNRAANCAAAGIPTTANAALVAACAGTSFPIALGAPFTNCTARTSSTGFTSGGNPTLVEERGKSLTLGVVIEPRFIPGLNLTVDYYNIEVTNLISALSAQTIINQCYSAAEGIGNPYCSTVNRDPATGLFVEPAAISGGINFARQKTKGIDFDVQYNHTFGNGDKLRLRGIATYLLRLDNYLSPTDPDVPNRQKGELGDPEWAAAFNANYDMGNFDITYSMRLLGRQTKGAYESQNPYIGRCPASGITGYTLGTCTPGDITTLDPANNDQYADPWFPMVTYHNLRLNWNTDDNRFGFYVGVDNVFDKKPPFGQLGTAGGDPYDTFGRYFYAGFKVNM